MTSYGCQSRVYILFFMYFVFGIPGSAEIPLFHNISYILMYFTYFHLNAVKHAQNACIIKVFLTYFHNFFTYFMHFHKFHRISQNFINLLYFFILTSYQWFHAILHYFLPWFSVMLNVIFPNSPPRVS